MLQNNSNTSRSLLHAKNYFFLNIAGLSIGLWSAILIILYVKDHVSYAPVYKEVNQGYCIDNENAKDVVVASVVENMTFAR